MGSEAGLTPELMNFWTASEPRSMDQRFAPWPGKWSRLD